MLYGGQVRNGKLNPDSAARCDKALEIAKSSRVSLIVFGVGYKIPDLAETTIAYLVNHGWSRERILWNPSGHTTLTETAAVLDTLTARQVASITVVTSWYHIPRTWLTWKLLEKRAGFDCLSAKFSASWQTSLIRLPFSLAWEAAGFAKLFLQLTTDSLQNELKPRT